MPGSAGRRRRPQPDGSTPLPIRLPLPPPVPGRILPEFSVPCDGAFDNPDFRLSIDWDGARTLLFASPDEVRLDVETLADVSHRFPEVVEAAEGLRQRSVVLDGVVAVLDPTGCPDLAALGERVALGPAVRRRLPTVFLATDLLHLGGRETMSLPLDRRLELLAGLAIDAPHLQVPDQVTGQGRALAEAARPRGVPALLARRGDARYLPGVASPGRLHIPLRRRANCLVVGAARVGSGTRRLRLAEYDGSRLLDAGAADVAETSTLWRWAAPGGRLRSPLTATVEHRGRGPDGRLRHPLVITLRDDVDPRRCLRRDPVPPPAGAAGAASRFRPTVLAALPLEISAGVPRASA